MIMHVPGCVVQCRNADLHVLCLPPGELAGDHRVGELESAQGISKQYRHGLHRQSLCKRWQALTAVLCVQCLSRTPAERPSAEKLLGAIDRIGNATQSVGFGNTAAAVEHIMKDQ